MNADARREANLPRVHSLFGPDTFDSDSSHSWNDLDRRAASYDIDGADVRVTSLFAPGIPFAAAIITSAATMLRQRFAALAVSATSSASASASASSSAASLARPLLRSSPASPSRTLIASQHRSIHTSLPRLATTQAKANSQSTLVPPKRSKGKGDEAAISTPEDFLRAISAEGRRELAGDSTLVKAMGETWEDMWTKVDGKTLKAAGVAVKDRR